MTQQARINGSIVGAIFAGVWAVFAGLALTGAGKTGLIVAGIVLSVALIATAARRRRAATAGGDQFALFKQRSYRLIVVAEVVAIGVGSAVLGHRNEGRGTISAWIALVVGIHFLALARFAGVRYFYAIGAVLMAVAVVGGIGHATSDWTNKTLTLVVTIPSAITLYLASLLGVTGGAKAAPVATPIDVTGR